MCLGQVLYSFIDFGLNTYYTKQILNYGFWPQVKAVAPYFLCALAVLAAGLLFSHVIGTLWLSLLASAIVCPLTYLLLCKMANLYAYQEMKEMVSQKILKRNVE
jgi:hypothetical protein